MGKQFTNGRDRAVTDAIDGFLVSSAGAGLARLDDFPDIKVVLRADWDRSGVAIVSGGGSGHEPAHAGYVGAGMLTAAVCGEIFASPSVDAVLAAILAVTGEAGCLLIVKNYTGDRLNFGLAAERARATGLAVETVIVADDVALPGAREKRGIAGTLFVHKLAGAAAAVPGARLADVHRVAADAASRVRSLGLSLTGCTLPGATGDAADRLGPGEAELGLGIHGEPGARVVPVGSADALVTMLADGLAGALADEAGADARYALLLNTLGGVSPLEAAVLAHAIGEHPIAERVELLVGPAPMMTSLDMRGMSLSVLPLDDERRRLLAAPAAPAAWPGAVPFRSRPALRAAIDTGSAVASAPPSRDDRVRSIVAGAAAALLRIAPDIDAIDARIGDGDTGSTLAGAAGAVADRLDALPFADGAALLRTVSDIVGRRAGGSSGVLLATFFAAASGAYAENRDWPFAFLAGLDRMKRHGGAELGDRTMIDALEPALRTLSDGRSLADAASAARAGSDATARMREARAGRAAVLRADTLDGVPDPGAEAVARLFAELAAA